ncbi:uncharacterized protein LOC110940468 isoform X2 [Helianthus annuus]|uniref:uncharacterized protein LOC110940468 isoform X2 n=1 Tax=Helianthus annuus TaxID=4232 RepID=UPI001652CE82|nr:uncharacterized protein LOC110940468 isoform X2 [Helianthus annuus]
MILHQTSIINLLIRNICSCNMFDERVYKIDRLILIVLWFYNMKQWRFKEFGGFEKLGFVVWYDYSSYIDFLENLDEWEDWKNDDDGIDEKKIMNCKRVLNKKRKYAQFHLDLGQSDFMFRNCKSCGMKFVPGDEDDGRLHKEFHKSYTHGIGLKLFCSRAGVMKACLIHTRHKMGVLF